MWNIIASSNIYLFDQSCISIIITPVFSVTWSSEIIIIYRLAAQETFQIIINVENSWATSYFYGNEYHQQSFIFNINKLNYELQLFFNIININ